MNPSFAYSFDRETFSGDFPTRDAAAAAGIRRAQDHPDSPGTVYVGQQLSPNPRAYGHARMVIDAMARRVRDDCGEIADDYLRAVAENQVMELDAMLEQTLLTWLKKNNLMPRGRIIEAISEHPVPTKHFAVSSNGRDADMTSIGESDYDYPVGL